MNIQPVSEGDEFGISAVNSDLRAYGMRLKTEFSRDEYLVEGEPVSIYVGVVIGQPGESGGLLYERAQLALAEDKILKSSSGS